MNKLSFHHLGLACENIQQGLEFLKQQFDVLEYSESVFDEKQNATLCMVKTKQMTGGGGIYIELISGTQVERIVKKRNFLYHTCYEVKDIESKIAELEGQDYMLVSPLKEAVLFGGRRVCFLSGNLGLIELLEAENNFCQKKCKL